MLQFLITKFKALRYHSLLEVVWNILPILCGMAISGFSLLYMIDDSSSVEFIIRNMGNQWDWTYKFDFLDIPSELYLDVSFDTQPTKASTLWAISADAAEARATHDKWDSASEAKRAKKFKPRPPVTQDEEATWAPKKVESLPLSPEAKKKAEEEFVSTALLYAAAITIAYLVASLSAYLNGRG